MKVRTAPAWEPCKECGEFICNIHKGQHVHDCPCPAIEEWNEARLDPYAPMVVLFEPEDGDK